MDCSLKVIARIHSDFPEKFGVPRQSGMVPQLEASVVFEPEYRSPEAIRGLEGFSHIWLIWGFSEVRNAEWSPTVRPPRLGGNQRVGVFATRSPYRPNPLGLSAVRLLGIERHHEFGYTLRVAGADLVEGTPIYDIKPYIPLADMVPDATEGFVGEHVQRLLDVVVPEELESLIPDGKRAALVGVLSQDPRPQYQDDPERMYGLSFAGVNVRFVVEGERLRVTVIESM